MNAIKFYKYQGAGNDFILIDNRGMQFREHHIASIEHLCSRRFGIGSDGFMLLQDAEGLDFEMLYYNADGKPSSMCGNGGRCIVAFAKKLGIINLEATFMAMDGLHHASLNAHGDWVSLQMIDVGSIKNEGEDYVLNTGSPHFVKMVEGLASYDVYTNGKAIRDSPAYQQDGINVNFVEAERDGYFVRTFERGVEDETFACGTGVTAVALAMAKKNKQRGDITTPIRVLGGKLIIRFRAEESQFSAIFLEGPATFVYEGVINLP